MKPLPVHANSQMGSRAWGRILPVILLLVVSCASAADPAALTDEQRREIEQALPAKAQVQPAKPRRLLIFSRNVGYGGHRPSRAHAEEAFTLMGRKTGAFETIVSEDPAVFERESLQQFDAVFLNNTIGNTFADPRLRQNLLEFVTGGGGLMGVHGTSIAFMNWQWPPVEDWPEFGNMIGARGAYHRDDKEHVCIKIDEPDHPLSRAFDGQGFERRDEFFRFHAPYSRHLDRVLLSMDVAKTDLSGIKPDEHLLREDNDYAVAWIRNYGRGRVFYCSLAHSDSVFRDAKMLQFYLDAAQFVLGDLDVPTTPSAKLSPAILAQEKLGWRLGVEAYTFHKFTFFDTIEKTAELGLPYIGGLSFMQQVSKDIPKNFDQNLTDDELRQIRLKMDSGGVRLLTYYAQDIPKDEAGCRKLFEFGRKMGFETFMCEPKPEQLDLLDKLANEYGINVAIHNHGQNISPLYWRPEGVLKACEGRSKRIGAAPDLGYWLRSGIDPVEAARVLKDRIITVQMHDLHEPGGNGHDVPWGSGAGKSEEFFRELHRQGIKPTMIGLEYSHDWFESMPKVAKCIEFFNATTLKLAATTPDAPGRANSAETVQDADGNVYHTVKIGNQVWTVENLRTTKFNDGKPIPNVTDDAGWKSLTTPGFCYYENKPENGKKHGALYNWWAASHEKIAPKGWRVPTREDQLALRDYLIANGYNYDGTKEGNKVGKSMTSATEWGFHADEGTAGNDLKSNNKSGFSAVPAGSRWNDGSFHSIGVSQYWWSTTPRDNTEDAYMSSIHSRFAKYGDNSHHKRSGFSIRLLRDADKSAQASSISGTVKNSFGAGLAGAQVKLESTGQSTTTDAKGNFSMVLAGLAPVSQTVTKEGYIDYRKDVIMITKEGYLDYQIHVPSQDAGKMAIEMIDCAGTVTDADGNVYQTVKIGDFVWTTTSLRTTKYNDGTPIPNVTDNKEWQRLSSPAWCYNENKPENGKNGLLYNWWAASHPKIAPKGWHVPSGEEQLAFRQYLVRNGYNFDGTKYPEWKGDYNHEKEKENKVGKSLAGRIGWQYRIKDKSGNVWEKELLISERPELNNKTGFNCLPNGARWNDGSFHNLTGSCYMWSTTQHSEIPEKGWLSSVHNWSRYLGDSSHVKQTGFGIRLIRDEDNKGGNATTLQPATETQAKSFGNPDKIDVLVVTGGHHFDPEPFFGIFKGCDDINYVEHRLKDESEVFEDVSNWNYDVVMLYNMTQEISPKRRDNFVRLLKDKGVGVVVVHHAEAAFQSWHEYHRIIGTAYIYFDVEIDGKPWPHCKCKGDQDIAVSVRDDKHPITRGMKDFTIHDETYKGRWWAEGNHVLLTTDHPDNDAPVAWTRQYGRSRVFNIQFGHDKQAYACPQYRDLLVRGVRWTAGTIK